MWKKETNKTTAKYYEVGPNGEYTEIPLDREHWWYVQFNATVETIFLTHGFGNPPAVYINRSGSVVLIEILRPELTSEEEMEAWREKRVFVEDDFNYQAECNSIENDTTDELIESLVYKIKII